MRTAPLIVCIVFAVIWVNAQFIRSGMLAPNFGVIHQAYAFNFNYLPVTCILVALISIFGALCFRFMRRLLLEWGILLSIIALALFALRHYITYI